MTATALNLLRKAVFDYHLRMLLTSGFTDVFLRLKHHVLGCLDEVKVNTKA